MFQIRKNWKWTVTWWLVLHAMAGTVRLRAEDRWVPIGPEGGKVMNVVSHPAQDGVLYLTAGDAPTSLYKSADRGNTWDKVAFSYGKIFSLAINRTNPNDLYAGLYGQIYRSTDGGSTWTSIAVNQTQFNDLLPDPLNPNVIHAAGYIYDTGLSRNLMAYLKSTDKGVTWSSLTLANTEGYGLALCLDPKNSQVLFLGGYAVGNGTAAKLFKTTDGGASWSDATGPLPYMVHDLIMDSTDVRRVLALTEFGFYWSTDMGAGWQKNNGFVSGRCLAQDPKNKNTLYIGQKNQVFASIDGGLNWTPYGNGLLDAKEIHCLLVDQNLPSTVYMGSDGGFFKSTDGGSQWMCCNTGIFSTHITAVHPIPSNPSVVYTAHQDGYVFRTQNAMAKKESAWAVSWEKVTTIPDCDSYVIRTILTDPSDQNLVYLYKSAG